MIAPRALPPEFEAWNRRWKAPTGGRPSWLFRRNRIGWLQSGPFALQGNNTTRAFEYPWAYQEIGALGASLDIVEIGGGLSGLQFVLAREGHRVTNVDPGLKAEGRGWELDEAAHRYLSKIFKAPVRLVPTTIDRAQVPDASVDVVLSVSVLEHLAPAELDSLASEIPRILRPSGRAIFTADLFLDVSPFCEREGNAFGRNIDVRAFLAAARLELTKGERAELSGFAEFEPRKILSNLSRYMIGVNYPALAQCLVAAPVRNARP
jgi:SAM-dependent methyltransferase